MLYTVADSFFYFLPVILGYTAAKKFKMSEFTGVGDRHRPRVFHDGRAHGR